MRRNFLKMAFVAVIVMVIGIHVFNTQKSEGLSDVALANVEALADDDLDGNWYCIGDVETCLKDDKGELKGEKHRIEVEEEEEEEDDSKDD